MVSKAIISKSLIVLIATGFYLIHPAYAADTLDDACKTITNPYDQRVCEEKSLRHKAFALVPHRPNYILGSWVDNLEQENEIYDDYETKFQLSFKVPLNKHEDDTRWLWFFGYTQISVWQMLNFEHSAPFRDTNFEPEIMSYYLANWRFGDWRVPHINIGWINHQSNGQVPPKSRSWNRSYVEFLFENGRNYINFKLWQRWKESPKNDPADYEGDDNPDIDEYVGHGELRIMHVGRKNNFGIVVRDNGHRDAKGSFQADWTFPVYGREEGKGELRFYVQYFYGYGETLIDYNVKRRRIGFGVMLADWL